MPDVTACYGIPFDFNIIDDNSCLNCCTSTKFSMTVCLMNTHIFIYRFAAMLMPPDFIAFFRLRVYLCMKCCI